MLLIISEKPRFGPRCRVTKQKRWLRSCVLSRGVQRMFGMWTAHWSLKWDLWQLIAWFTCRITWGDCHILASIYISMSSVCLRENCCNYNYDEWCTWIVWFVLADVNALERPTLCAQCMERPSLVLLPCEINHLVPIRDMNHFSTSFRACHAVFGPKAAIENELRSSPLLVLRKCCLCPIRACIFFIHNHNL